MWSDTQLELDRRRLLDERRDILRNPQGGQPPQGEPTRGSAPGDCVKGLRPDDYDQALASMNAELDRLEGELSEHSAHARRRRARDHGSEWANRRIGTAPRSGGGDLQRHPCDAVGQGARSVQPRPHQTAVPALTDAAGHLPPLRIPPILTQRQNFIPVPGGTRMLLHGKTVVVSGVGAGLGHRIAETVVRDGGNAVLGARTEANLAKSAAEIDPEGAAPRTGSPTSPTRSSAGPSPRSPSSASAGSTRSSTSPPGTPTSAAWRTRTSRPGRGSWT